MHWSILLKCPPHVIAYVVLNELYFLLNKMVISFQILGASSVFGNALYKQ